METERCQASGREGRRAAAATACAMPAAPQEVITSPQPHSRCHCSLAADDLIVSAYFLTLYALARGVPPEQPSTASLDEQAARGAPAPAASASPGTLQAVAEGAAPGGAAQPRAPAPAAPAPAAGGHGGGAEDTRTITVLHGATALALAAAICFAGTSIATALRYTGGSITVITAITGLCPSTCVVSAQLSGTTRAALPCATCPLPPTLPAPCSPYPHPVTLATLFPAVLAPLRASGEGLAAILMQLFFASVGASGSIVVVMKTAPTLFLWSAVSVSSEQQREREEGAGRAGQGTVCGCAPFVLPSPLPHASPPPRASSPPGPGAGGGAAVGLHPQGILPRLQRQHRRCVRCPAVQTYTLCAAHGAAAAARAAAGGRRGVASNAQRLPTTSRLCSRAPAASLPHISHSTAPAGPTTAAGMAAAKGWHSSLVPALLIGIMGYATATFIGVACATVFRHMQFA